LAPPERRFYQHAEITQSASGGCGKSDGIGRKEAKQIGLPVEYLDGEAEELVWALYEEFEERLNLTANRDAKAYFTDIGPDLYQEDNVMVACIESANLLHGFIGQLRLQRIRRIPQQPTINVNLSLSLPPNIDPAQMPSEVQAALQQLL
jgi:hypothetical protein